MPKPIVYPCIIERRCPKCKRATKVEIHTKLQKRYYPICDQCRKTKRDKYETLKTLLHKTVAKAKEAHRKEIFKAADEYIKDYAAMLRKHKGIPPKEES